VLGQGARAMEGEKGDRNPVYSCRYPSALRNGRPAIIIVTLVVAHSLAPFRARLGRLGVGGALELTAALELSKVCEQGPEEVVLGHA
jgi:hypothetical protein